MAASAIVGTTEHQLAMLPIAKEKKQKSVVETQLLLLVLAETVVFVLLNIKYTEHPN